MPMIEYAYESAVVSQKLDAFQTPKSKLVAKIYKTGKVNIGK